MGRSELRFHSNPRRCRPLSLVWLLLLGCLLLGILLGPLGIGLLIGAASDDRGRKIGDWTVGIGLQSIWRPSLTFNAGNELTLKRRSYDEEHDEQKITFGGLTGGVERFLDDPQNRLHEFFGTPFGFVDEWFGIVFDPRDATVGREHTHANDVGDYENRKVSSKGDLHESVLGVFEIGGDRVGVNLPDVWALVGGSFDAQGVRQIREYYKKSQAPKAQTSALRQLLVPVGTFIAIVLLGIFAAGQGASGGGAAASAAASTANDTTVGVNPEDLSVLLLSILGLGDWERRNIVVAGAGVLGALGIAAMLLFAFPMWVPILGISLPLGVWALLALGGGMAVLPITAAWFGRSLGGVGMVLGKLFLTIGLLGYDRPIITLTRDDRYELREYGDRDDWAVKPRFYRFALTRLGVGLENRDKVWGEDVVESPARVDEMTRPLDQSPVTDGGADLAPSGYATTEQISQAGTVAHVPKTVDEDATYVRTDLTTGWFFDAGQNGKLMTAALERAKEEFGGGQKPVSDKYILGASLVAMVLGAAFDYLVFFS